MKIKIKDYTMFYYILFFILCAPTVLRPATITPDEFKTMISFIKKTDLTAATDAEYEKFMTYSQRIAEDGTSEQKSLVEAVLEGDDIEESTAEEKLESLNSPDDTFTKINTLLESDIITPEVWQTKVMQTLKEIDSTGTPAEKESLNAFIHTHKERIVFHCKKLINSLYYDSTVKEALQFIIVNTLIGVLPSLGLKSLSILAGNLPIAAASTQLADLSVLCALDSIVRYGMSNQSEYITGPVAAGLSTAIQDFIGFAGPRPTGLNIFGATITTTELASLQAATIVFAKNNLIKPDNIAKMVSRLNWKDLALGSNTQLVSTTAEETTLIGYIQNALAPVLKNKTVRAVTATTVSYAVEGALLAAALNVVGLGFYTESTTQALVAGMARGALEGLFMHATNKVRSESVV